MSSIAFPSPPQRILIIKPSAIGDVVHTLPVLSLLRQRFPRARISWLLNSACAGLLEGHPLLDEVIRFDRQSLARWWYSPRMALGLIRFTRELRRRRFDLVVDLQGLFRSGYLARSTASGVRLGFANARELSWLFYTHRVRVGDGDQHAIERYLKLVAALGCDGGPVRFDFGITQAERDAAAALAGDGGPYAVLLPGTNWPTKRWPVQRFAALVQPLRERFGLRCITAGGSDGAGLARQIPDSLDLSGKTSLRVLVSLLDRAALVVANDSGPMHIAAALGRPLVSVFGPTNPVRTGPYGRMDTVVRLDIPCSPCYSRKCNHQSCLQLLDVEPVLAEAQRQMEARLQRT